MILHLGFFPLLEIICYMGFVNSIGEQKAGLRSEDQKLGHVEEVQYSQSVTLVQCSPSLTLKVFF